MSGPDASRIELAQLRRLEVASRGEATTLLLPLLPRKAAGLRTFEATR